MTFISAFNVIDVRPGMLSGAIGVFKFSGMRFFIACGQGGKKQVQLSGPASADHYYIF